MRRRAGVLFVALAVLLAACDSADPVEQAMRSVVSVIPQWPPDIRRTEEPEGSGVIVLDGRTVLTAAHIVNKALSVQVRTSGGEILDARIEGRDTVTDLALLSIPTSLPAIVFEEDDPELGDRVCAIGNSFGLGLSVTCGVVSGVHRAGIGFNPVEDFVQTDAAVNPGASGGALVSDNGEFVGLLSAIFTKRSDANIGVNFAVSAKLAGRVARELAEQGSVALQTSGMRLVQTPAKGETGKLGARVASLQPGSLAEKAGIKPGDIIIRAGGRRIRKPPDFVSVMATLTEEGLELTVIREGKENNLKLAP